MKNLITLLFVFYQIINLYAQQKEYKYLETIDYVHSISGMVYSGKIISFEKDHLLFLLGSSEIKIRKDQIARIIQGDKFEISKKTIPDLYGSNKYGKPSYHSVGLHTSFLFDYLKDDLELNHIGGHISTGIRINPAFNLGIGTGIDINFRSYIPIFLECRGRMINRKFSPIYSLATGYSIPIFRKDLNGNSVEQFIGGLYFYPSIGVNISNTISSKMFIDLGIRFQEHRTRQRQPGGDYLVDRIIWTDNFVLRIGTLF